VEIQAKAPLKIDLIPHTVFLLCGPTHSGKSTFAENLVDLAQHHGLSALSISSDEIRKDLLANSGLANSFNVIGGPDRYAETMSVVSPQAFNLLVAELKAITSFPINTEVVVIDTTGMDEMFRKEMKDITENAGYAFQLVTFEYKYRSDYIPENTEGRRAEVIERSVTRFRQKILPSLGSKDYPNRLRIKNKESFAIPFSSIEGTGASILSDLAKDKIELYLSSQGLAYSGNPAELIKTFAVIGDTHECVEELGLMIGILESRYPGIRIVHIGDYMDKGGETSAMVDLMYSRLSAGDIIIQGNHETYLARRLRGEISAQPDVEKTYFTAMEALLADKELAAKFLQIYDASKPFAVLCDIGESGNLPVFVTHAPCKTRHLAKIHNSALVAQRNYRTKDRTVPVLQEFDWLFNQAERYQPLHIFGHLSHRLTDAKALGFRNKIFLDTGVVYGGKLTAVVLEYGKIIDQISVNATKVRAIAELPENLGFGPKIEKEFKLSDYDLDGRDLRLLRQIEDNGVQYISGTMAPAPSWDGKIEPLQGAFSFLKARGVTEICLQPKYMGSRCQMYLFAEDSTKTFAVSRGGWVIKGVDGKTKQEYEDFLKSVWIKFYYLFDSYGDIVLDGELLPWAALGAGLIDNLYTSYERLIQSELEVLRKDFGFLQLEEFKDKYDLSAKAEHLNSFKEVLGRYSTKGEPSFKAFNILSKTLNEEGQPTSSFDIFNLVNEDGALLVNTEKFEDVEAAQNFFTTLTVGNGVEGVVVKPLIPTKGQVPYMKVRSEEYLRLVYGYNYLDPARYDRLVRQKNVSGKVRLSIAEHDTATAMLGTQGGERKMLAVKLIGQIKEEKVLDPRL
jgi:predicted kinase